MSKDCFQRLIPARMVMEEDTGSHVNGPDQVEIFLSTVPTSPPLVTIFKNYPLDQIITCNNLITWDPKGSVKIRMDR